MRVFLDVFLDALLDVLLDPTQYTPTNTQTDTHTMPHPRWEARTQLCGLGFSLLLLFTVPLFRIERKLIQITQQMQREKEKK
jgi:hypothetical protein